MASSKTVFTSCLVLVTFLLSVLIPPAHCFAGSEAYWLETDEENFQAKVFTKGYAQGKQPVISARRNSAPDWNKQVPILIVEYEHCADDATPRGFLLRRRRSLRELVARLWTKTRKDQDAPGRPGIIVFENVQDRSTIRMVRKASKEMGFPHPNVNFTLKSHEFKYSEEITAFEHILATPYGKVVQKIARSFKGGVFQVAIRYRKAIREEREPNFDLYARF